MPPEQPLPRKTIAQPLAPARNPIDPSPAELGRRIKLMRVEKGLTLKDLEKRGGISATHVSEIERGKASPTVGALGKIARALGVRPATLLGPRVFPDVTLLRAEDRTSRRVNWGAGTIDPATDPISRSTLGAQILTLPIGREPALAHRHEGEEWLTVLSGAAEIRFENETFVLREGESLHFRAERMHAYCNPASSPAVLLAASLPRLAI